MRIRTVLAAAASAVLAAALAAFPLAGVAAAQEPTDRDCRDFASQAAAQSALRSHSGDPERLDADHNGVACEDYFKMAAPAPPAGRAVPPPSVGVVPPPAQTLADDDPSAPVVVPPPGAPADAPIRTVPEHQILVKPQGAADTGDGSAAPLERAPLVLLVGGLGAVAVGAGLRRTAQAR
jgi:hypothetical protein